jgi:hypothetical protein
MLEQLHWPMKMFVRDRQNVQESEQIEVIYKLYMTGNLHLIRGAMHYHLWKLRLFYDISFSLI